MKTPPRFHAETNDLAYIVKTHYAKLILDHLRKFDRIYNDPAMGHEPIHVHISESYNYGEKDNTPAGYTLRYAAKQNTRVLELAISESSIQGYSDRIEKTISIYGCKKHYEYRFNICALRGNNGDPIVLPTSDSSTIDKDGESKIEELDQEVLEALDLFT